MASPEFIQEYLVKLGYKVDKTTERTFKGSLSEAGSEFKKLSTTIAGAVTGAYVGTNTLAESMRNVYFSSKLAGTSVQGLKAMQYASKQLGIDAGATQATLQALNMTLLTNPGSRAFLENLGIDTKGDTEKTLKNIYNAVKKMNPFYAASFLEKVGLSYEQFYLLADSMGEVDEKTDHYNKMLDKQGLNMNAVYAENLKYTNGLDDMSVALKGVLTTLGTKAEPYFNRFNNYVQDSAEKLSKYINEFKGFEEWLGLKNMEKFSLAQYGGITSGMISAPIVGFGQGVKQWYMENVYPNSPLKKINDAANANSFEGQLKSAYSTDKEGTLNKLSYYIVKNESAFKRNAYNEESGARGYGQIVPSTGKKPGYGEPLKGDTLEAHLEFIKKYLSGMADKQFGGDIHKALQAYHAGVGNISNPDYTIGPKNKAYVRNVESDFVLDPVHENERIQNINKIRSQEGGEKHSSLSVNPTTNITINGNVDQRTLASMETSQNKIYADLARNMDVGFL